MSAGRLFVGRVVRMSTVGGHIAHAMPIASVRIPQNEFNAHLNMYFPSSEDKWALMNGVDCKMGDEVLVRQSESPLARNVELCVDRVIAKFGAPTDPITNRRNAVAFERHDDYFQEHSQHRTETINKLLDG